MSAKFILQNSHPLPSLYRFESPEKPPWICRCIKACKISMKFTFWHHALPKKYGFYMELNFHDKNSKLTCRNLLRHPKAHTGKGLI